MSLPRDIIERLREIEEEHFNESIAFTKVYDDWMESIRGGYASTAGDAPVGNPPFFFVWVAKATEIEHKRSWQGPVETVTTSMRYEWDMDMIKQMDEYPGVGGMQSMRQYLMGKGMLLPS